MNKRWANCCGFQSSSHYGIKSEEVFALKVAVMFVRLRWGAGANPALWSLVPRVEQAWRTARATSLSHAAACHALALHARAAAHARPHVYRQRGLGPSAARTTRQALAHWEKVYTPTPHTHSHTPPPLIHNNNILPQYTYSIITYILQACTLAMKYSLDVSPVEESLMEMLHPEGNIDKQWVRFINIIISLKKHI